MKRRMYFFGGLFFIALLFFVAASLYLYGHTRSISLEQVSKAIESLGIMAPVVFLGLCILRGLVFFPCGIVSLLGGMLFGALSGTILTLVGLTAGSVCTFYMARGCGRGWIQRVLKHKYAIYEGYVSRSTFFSVFLMRVVPVLPFDAVSCIAGMSRAGVGKFILGTFAGSLPGVFLYTYFGDSVRSLSVKRMILSVIIIVIFAAIPLFYKYLTGVKQKTA